MAAPSPSKHHTFLDFFVTAIPRAMEEAWPIDPTVRKSLSCSYLRLSLNSYNSLERKPVEETTTSCFPNLGRIRFRASSLDN
jgi:hypothetical protein